MPLLELPGASIWVPFGVAIAMLVIAVYMLTGVAEVGGAALAKVLNWLRVLGSVVGAAALTGIWGVVSPAPSLILMGPASALVALTPMLAGRAGHVRLMVKRRK